MCWREMKLVITFSSKILKNSHACKDIKKIFLNVIWAYFISATVIVTILTGMKVSD